MRSKSLFVIMLAAAATVGCSSDTQEAGLAPNTAQGMVPDLSGTWVVNRDLSEFPRLMPARARMRHGPVDSATRTARIAEFKSQVTTEDSARFAARRANLRARMAERGIAPDSLRRAFKARARDGDLGALTISQSGSSITLGAGRHTQTLVTDGTPVVRSAQGKSLSTTAKWVGATLVIERAGPRGAGVTTVHELSDDGQRLTSTTTVSRPGGEARSFTVVRDRK